MDKLHSPLDSLKSGSWFKLIGGASFQDLPAVRSLALAYALAGADCIDTAADPAVVAAVGEALAIAQTLAGEATVRGFRPGSQPWLMVSLNDGEDPHFRKATFDPTQCPTDCPRPCESICPASAIAFSDIGGAPSGVIDARCYGCGRCLPVCPVQLIATHPCGVALSEVGSLVGSMEIDAIEIHTQVGRFTDFQRLWSAISTERKRLKLLAISCPNGADLIDYLKALYDLISPLPCPLVWQTDGRPMSGDLGKGATRAAVELGRKVLGAELPGFVQLAGGTNQHTVAKLKAEGLLKPLVPRHPEILGGVAGVAYGSYARSLLLPILDKLEQQSDDTHTLPHLENFPNLLWQAVTQANTLVSPLKERQIQGDGARDRGLCGNYLG
ncbi:MAG: LdpA C-terminal domain-containing domain [Cyanobacteriota bacterium]|nr:LdpA C-terminal domain-containing domain [Cyanobacteriota bacterium]